MDHRYKCTIKPLDKEQSRNAHDQKLLFWHDTETMFLIKVDKLDFIKIENIVCERHWDSEKIKTTTKW